MDNSLSLKKMGHSIMLANVDSLYRTRAKELMFHSGTILQSCIASILNCNELHAPLLPRADGKGGVLIISVH
jgi:hypothetical protein